MYVLKYLTLGLINISNVLGFAIVLICLYQFIDIGSLNVEQNSILFFGIFSICGLLYLKDYTKKLYLVK